MRKLSVSNGRYTQGVITMAFVAKASYYLPLFGEVENPSWFTFTLCMVLAIVANITFDFFIKREGTRVNGKNVDLNGVNIEVNEDHRISLGVPKGTEMEDLSKIIDAVKTISDNISEVKND